MRTWVKCVLLVYAVALIGVALTALIQGISEKPTLKGWSADAIDYRDNYLGSPAGFCILKKTGMPPGPIPKAAALTECASEKLANRTDGSVDLIDLRAILTTYMIYTGRYPGDYADGCAALSSWESACKVPETYVFDCSQILDFINANEDDIKAVIDECSA